MRGEGGCGCESYGVQNGGMCVSSVHVVRGVRCVECGYVELGCVECGCVELGCVKRGVLLKDNVLSVCISPSALLCPSLLPSPSQQDLLVPGH